jgi:hypothetical protein
MFSGLALRLQRCYRERPIRKSNGKIRRNTGVIGFLISYTKLNQAHAAILRAKNVAVGDTDTDSLLRAMTPLPAVRFGC